MPMFASPLRRKRSPHMTDPQNRPDLVPARSPTPWEACSDVAGPWPKRTLDAARQINFRHESPAQTHIMGVYETWNHKLVARKANDIQPEEVDIDAMQDGDVLQVEVARRVQPLNNPVLHHHGRILENLDTAIRGAVNEGAVE